MAQKITQSQIEQMISLYQTIGTYSGVAKEMGISATTVSRYIKNYKPIISTPILPPHEFIAKPIEEISFTLLLTYSTLTSEEQASYNKWLKEFGR